MSRMKTIFAVLVVAAIVGIVPQAFAVNPIMEVTLAGSSAMWQTAAVGAFNNGVSLVGGSPTFHYTSKSNKAALTDSRPTLVGGSNAVDNGTLWIVWDSPASGARHVWAYAKVDSVVGARCYFARPTCTIVMAAADLTTVGNQINFPGTPWGSNTDVVPPADVLNVFEGLAGTLNKIGAAATDIRAEDAAFAMCRVNSSLGAGTVNTGDALDGLGYNAANPAGACPQGTVSLAQGLGSSIKSGVIPATGAVANPLAFNLTGKDPFSGTSEPAYKQISVGAEPLVFIVARSNNLKGVHHASSVQLEQVFSGANCDASAFGDAFSGGLNIFLREPLSGTMNATEATVFRRPTVNGASGSPALGASQETHVGANNPLQGQAGTCILNPSGKSARYRGVGTGEVVNNGVLASNTAYPTAQDGIAYTFFSYGNVAKLANQDAFGYLTLNGIDPIFNSYGNQPSGTPYDPGQPADGAAGGPGILPGAANLPATCEGGAGNFPCSEDLLWGTNLNLGTTPLSFPNVRNGSYPAWNILRVISDSGAGGQYTALSALVTASNKAAVGYVPDYVPIKSVVSFTVVSHVVPKDPGFLFLRSHYQQKDGAGNLLGPAPHNISTTEAGGDMGGHVLSTSTTNSQNAVTQQVQGDGGFQIRP